MQAAGTRIRPDEGYFCDGLGVRRLVTDSTTGESLEILEIAGDLAAGRSFEFALRERVSRLSAFQHPSYTPVRGVDRRTNQTTPLTLVSDHTPGVRLSELLARCESGSQPIDNTAALSLIRQIVTAVAALHEHARDVAHGAIAPERIIITPHGRIAIVEYVLGAALEQLRLSHEQYWKDLRIALPRSAGAPRFDHRADVVQVGMVALSLLLGRAIRSDEYPARLAELVASLFDRPATGDREELPQALRTWLLRALQLEWRNSFSSALEARDEFDKVTHDKGRLASPAALEAVVASYLAAGLGTAPSRPAVEAAVDPMRDEPFPGSPMRAKVLPMSPGAAFARFEPGEPDVERAGAPDAAVATAAAVAVETPDDWPPEPITDAPSRWLRAAAGVSVLMLLCAGAWFASRHYLVAPTPVATGSLSVTTSPAGVQVFVDGVRRGRTPLSLSLESGQHVVDLRAGSERRSLPLTMKAGAEFVYHIELPKPPAPVAAPAKP